MRGSLLPSMSSVSVRSRLGVPLVFATAALAAALSCSESTTQPFNFTPIQLAGTWTYVGQPGDTISVTLAVTDTVITGTGFATNAELRALSGGTVTRVPLIVTGWVSPSQKRLHLDGSSPAVPLLAAQLDATVIDATHLSATWTITVNGAAFWTQSTTVTIPKS